MQDRRAGLVNGGSTERRTTGQHFVEDHAKRPDIAARIGGGTLQDFGRKILRRSHNRARHGHRVHRERVLRGVRDSFGEAEIEHLDVASRHHDVAGLDIAMEDAFGVRGFQGIGDLRAEGKGCACLQRLITDVAAERAALQQLHDQVRTALRLACVENGADIGMAQSAGSARLTLETLPRGVVLEGIGQYLDGHVAAKPRVPSPIHVTHAALADRLQDGVASELVASGERHY